MFSITISNWDKNFGTDVQRKCGEDKMAHIMATSHHMPYSLDIEKILYGDFYIIRFK